MVTIADFYSPAGINKLRKLGFVDATVIMEDYVDKHDLEETMKLVFANNLADAVARNFNNNTNRYNMAYEAVMKLSFKDCMKLGELFYALESFKNEKNIRF